MLLNFIDISRRLSWKFSHSFVVQVGYIQIYVFLQIISICLETRAISSAILMVLFERVYFEYHEILFSLAT